MTLDYAALEARTLWRVLGFAEERRPAGTRYRWRNVDRAPGVVVFQATLRGGMRFEEDDRIVGVPVGSAALFAHGEDTAYGLGAEDVEGYDCMWVEFAGAGLLDHWRLLRARHGSVVAVDEPILRACRRLMALAQPRSATDPLVMADAAHQFVLDLMRALGRSYARRQPPVERALDELLRRPTQPWSLKEVAERFGCSREHLTRVFTQRMGVPPATWVNRQRVERALRLLRESSLPIGVVAEQCGFASSHTLARQVREATGRSPRAWRRGEGHR